MKQHLFTPGPTTVPPAVLEATSRPMMHHRSRAFRPIMRSVRERLSEVFCTRNEVLMIAGTGTGACESAVVNLTRPGETVLCVSAGWFGDVWTRMARLHGCDVRTLTCQWGEQPTANAVAATIAETNPTVVFLVHSETSTGAVCDLEAILRVCNQAGVLTVVDAISSLGAVPLLTDQWGADVVVAATQKGLMCPPGLGLVSVSEDAWEKVGSVPRRSVYWDWPEIYHFQIQDDTPFTAAVPIIVGLNVALWMLLHDEGLDHAYDRHRWMGIICREGIHGLGLGVWSPDDPSSAVLTAVEVEDPIGFAEALERVHGVIVAPGHGGMGNVFFRVGHVGYMNELDVGLAISAIRQVVHVNAIGSPSHA